jgi:hypothetical protein
MTGFELSTNYVENPKPLFKRTRAKLKKIPTTSSEINQIRMRLTTDFEALDDMTLHEFSAPTTVNMRTGSTVNVGDNIFEFKPA